MVLKGFDIVSLNLMSTEYLFRDDCQGTLHFCLL